MKIRIHVRTVVKLKFIDFAGFQLQILLETDLIDIFRSLEMNQNTAIVRLQNRFALRRLLSLHPVMGNVRMPAGRFQFPVFQKISACDVLNIACRQTECQADGIQSRHHFFHLLSLPVV